MGSNKAECGFGVSVDVMGDGYGLLWKIYCSMGDANYGNYFSNLSNPPD